MDRFSSLRKSRRNKRRPSLRARLFLEPLEARALLTGPDGFGYVAAAVPFQNINFHAGDPGVFTVVTDGDIGVGSVNLGSNTVNFYGQTYTGANQLWVSGKGLITFGSSNNAWNNTDLTSSPSQSAIAIFWTDLVKYSGPDRVVGKFVDTTGSGTPNELIIEWDQVYRFATSVPMTFQAILQLNAGTNTSAITFNYVSTITGSASSNNGADATIGIKDAFTQGPNRLLLSYKSTSQYVGSQQAVQFTAPPFGSNLSGNVYNDFNRNGVHDPGEPGLANWQVYLDLKRDGKYDPGDPVTVTDASGNYTFIGVPAGSYQVGLVTQPGWTQSTPAGAFTPPAVGPDPFGYGAYAAPYQNIELFGQNDPSVFTIVNNGDDVSLPVNLGSNTFNFYGTTYSGNNQVFVSTNGLITFGASDIAWTNGDLSTSPREPAIAPLWYDWLSSSSTPMILGKFVDTTGSGTPNELIIEWHAVQAHPTILNTIEWQTILQLNSGASPSNILLNYVNLNTGIASMNNGGTATVGIEDTPGQPSYRLLVSQNNGSNPLIGSGKAVLLTTAAPGTYGEAVSFRQNVTGLDFGAYRPPFAGNASYNVNENAPLSVPAPGVLANANSSLPGQPLTAILVSSVSHGTLTFNSDGSFTYTPSAEFFGSDSFTYKVNDSHDSNVATVALTVNQVADAPQLSVFSPTGFEGTGIPLQITAAPGDNDGSETLSVTISGVPAGDSLSAGTDNGNGVWSLTPGQLAGLTILAKDAGVFALTVTATSTAVSNNATASTSANLQVTVNDITPSNIQLNLSAATINENDSTTLSGSFSDAGSFDTHRVDIDWGDGRSNSFVLPAGILQFGAISHQYFDEPASGNSYTVTVTVADENAVKGSVSTSVTVNNVAPSNVQLNLSAATINENDSTALSGSFVDPGTLDTHTVVINWGDGSSNTTLNLAGGVLSFSGASHQYLDNPASGSSYAINATVTDDHGASGSGNTSVTVNNVPPSNLQLSLSSTTINENGSTALSGSFTDPGTLDTHTVVINWGDGGSTTVNLAAGVLTFSGAGHQYLDTPPSGSYAVAVTVTDSDGASTSAATSVNVINLPPANAQLTLSAATINENDSTTLSGSFVDPGTLDTHTVVINWGDGSSNTTLNLGAGMQTFGGVSHQYLDNPAVGSKYDISVTITDKDNGSASVITSVTVNNVAPSNVQLSLSAATINENDSTTLSGSFSDPGTLDTHSVVINWGDGTSNTTVNLAAGVLTFSGVSHQYLDNPAVGSSYAVTATVTDNDGGSGSGSTSVTVNNVAPSAVQVSLSAATINENDYTSLSGSFVDPGTLDTHTVVINWGDGSGNSTVNLAAGVLNFSGALHQYLDNPPGGSYTITATVTDKDGASGTGSTSVTVNNVPPANLQLSLNPTTINENGSTALSGSFTDPGTLDTHTVVITWGDGGSTTVNLGAGVLTFNGVSHQYLDTPPTGSYAISVTVTDNDGASTAAGTSVNVSNLPPSNIQLALSQATINENDSTVLSGSFSDPGTLDTHTVVINWGDGSSNTTLTLGADVLTFSGVSHQYLDNPASGSTYTISVTITDKDNGSGSGSTSVTVNNVAPSSVQLGLSAATINENDSTLLSGAFVDPGTLDTHSVVINWGDGTANTTLNLGAGVLTFSGVSHQYLDNPPGGSYAITATVTDNDGGSGSGSTSVTVNNVAPSNLLLSLNPATFNENGSTTLNGSFADPGTLDTHTVVINWGDGSSNTAFNLQAGVLAFSGASHQYLDTPPSGSYAVTVTVTDGDGASTSAGTTVSVNNVAPANVQLTASPATINENDFTTVSGSFTDPGTLDTHTVVINWGDGSSNTTLSLGAGVVNFSGVSHQYLDEATYSITAMVADKDNGTGMGTASVVVNNVAPSNVQLSLSAATINENDATTLSGIFTDPGTLDTHAVVINWGDNSYTTLNLAAGVLSFGGVSHQYLDNPASGSSYSITAMVSDNGGASGSGSTSVTVNNVAPSNLLLSLNPATINENGSTALSGSFTDPGTLDTHTVVVTWGDGTSTTVNLGAGVLAFSGAGHQYLDTPPSGNYAVSVTVTDGDGASTSAGTTVSVNNVAPANVQLTASPSTINENGFTTLSGSFTDPGTLDTHTVVINWGDNSSSTTLSVGAGVVNFSGVSHQYLATGAYTVTATVADKDNGTSSGTASVTVNNVAPFNVQLSLSAATINENGTTTLSGSFTDPGTLDTHTVVINWGDNSSNTSLSLGAGVLNFLGVSHQYLASGAYTVTATVTDKDNGTGSGTAGVTVNNVAPSNVQLSLSAATINENGTTTLSGSFTDPGTLDTHTVVINWGDNSTSTVNLAAGVLTFSGASHQYLDEPASGNIYTIGVTVTDKDNGSGSGSTSITVNNVTPANLQLALSASSIPVNGTISLSGSFIDPATLDIHNVVITWGDTTSSTFSLGAGVPSFSGASHRYTSAGGFLINVTVIDADPASVSAGISVQVVGSTALAASITGPSSGVRGQEQLFTLNVAGAASGDTIKYAIDWTGNHHVDQTVTGPAAEVVPHVFTNSGKYTIGITATDQTTGVSATASTTITIEAVELQADPLYPGKFMLVVGGTMGNDKIEFKPAGHSGMVRVLFNDRSLGTFAPTSRIVAYGQAGNDTIRVSNRIHLSAWLFAGAGNDFLQGGGGNNVLVGGAGNDTLVGGLGRDLLIGGAGTAKLVGRGNEDILIGGSTAFDHNEAALSAIMKEWTSSHDRATRIADLSGTGSGSSFNQRLNGNVFLRSSGPGTTVFDDHNHDVLYVRPLDWFFAGQGDTVKHK